MSERQPTRTTCPYCGVGCGVLASRQADGSTRIAGDPDHPANAGRLCSKGSALGETLDLERRLLAPEVDGRRVDWEQALDHVATRLTATIAEHGPQSVAFYVSGQLLTEDYYVANKLMKGYIGTANIDTNSRLCMASSVAGHRRAFGSDTVPGTYADLDEADLVVLVGSNLAWCHPVLFQRVLAAREARGTRLIVIDPRRTTTAEAADLHLALEPESDLPLFLGLLNYLEQGGHRDRAYMEEHVGDGNAALAIAAEFPIDRVARETDLDAEAILDFYAQFADDRKIVTVYSQGINQSVSGTDKVNAIINCHLLTGRIGRPGMGPFSVTGQPNAMGGREVGGLATMLAAHMDIDNAAHREIVQRFWKSPGIADRTGLKAVDLFEAAVEGRIKALWIMATNPVDSMPDADRVRTALAHIPFVVVSDAMRDTDTTSFAHVLLPATTWGEKDGTVTNSERRISRQRAFLPAPGEARPDWWHLVQVARRMGFSGFDFETPADIFAEHAALSGFENDGRRDFDISAHEAIDAADYEALLPFQWPRPRGVDFGSIRFFSEGNYYTPDKRARMVAVNPTTNVKVRNAEFPLWLNTGRIRDQWHTMTRSAKSARLMAQFAEPFCEIHPWDAEIAGLGPASLVVVETPQGIGHFRVLITSRQKKGSIFVPMHWTDRFASRARVNALTHPATDPLSGQPGLKASPAMIRPFRARWYGFAVAAQRPDPASADYWAIAQAEGGYRTEMAGLSEMTDGQRFAADLFHASPDAEWISYHDREAGLSRYAAFHGSRLIGALYLSPEPVEIARSFVVEALAGDLQGMARLRLLAGRGGDDRPDPGAMICACFAVGINQIVAAIREGGAMNVEDVGRALKAGTNCGSCRGEIRRVVDEYSFEKAG